MNKESAIQAQGWIRIGASSDLIERGAALCFPVRFEARNREAFAVRFQGQPHAYLNQCAHIPSEMDWQPGQFFDLSRLYLICATHGALYLPESGLCIDGPCAGRSLLKIETLEQGESIYWRPNDLIQPIIFSSEM